ncbi:hypothetical protein D4R51_03360 [bacterium]|nr:MAG: hypothetical protein D4R51_03360 [bacterium]
MESGKEVYQMTRELSAEEISKAEELKIMINEIAKKDIDLKFYDQQIIFYDNLKKTYGNEVNNCLLVQILLGSSLKEERGHFFDFKGKDSIEQFILNCYNELFTAQENNQVKK